MYNIKFKGKFKNEEQLKKGELPKEAIIFREPKKIYKAFILGLIISLPLTIPIVVVLIKKSGVNLVEKNNFYISIILSLLSTPIHEIIHGLCFSREEEKHVFTKFEDGALIIHCNEHLLKKKFIWMCAAPNIILGFIPYILYIIGIFDFNINIEAIVGLTATLNILSGIGDYLNIFNAIIQVPKKAKVFNYGINSYWII